MCVGGRFVTFCYIVDNFLYMGKCIQAVLLVKTISTKNFNACFKCSESTTQLIKILFFAHLLPRPHPPFVNIRDTTSLIQLIRFSILFGGKVKSRKSQVGVKYLFILASCKLLVAHLYI